MTSRNRNRVKRQATRKDDISSIPRDLPYTAFGKQSPLAMRLRTTLSYSDIIPIASLAFRDYQFRLNSLFDPDFTGTGHQPMGYDQLITLYGRYRVFQTRYKVAFINISTGVTNPCIGVVVPTNDVAGYSVLTNAIEQYGSQWLMYRDGVSPKLNELTGVVNLPKLNGKSHVAYAADDTTQAITNTNPSETLQLHVCVGTADATTNVAGYFAIQLWFDVEFSDPVELNQS